MRISAQCASPSLSPNVKWYLSGRRMGVGALRRAQTRRYASARSARRRARSSPQRRLQLAIVIVGGGVGVEVIAERAAVLPLEVVVDVGGVGELGAQRVVVFALACTPI